MHKITPLIFKQKNIWEDYHLITIQQLKKEIFTFSALFKEERQQDKKILKGK